MPDREKTALGIREMIMRDTWRDIDAYRTRYQHILNDALALLKEKEAIRQCKDCKNNFGGDYMTIVKEITAVFIGKNGSMGFKNGQEYKLWFFEKNGRYYISRRSENATAIPYSTMTALKKNWNF